MQNIAIYADVPFILMPLYDASAQIGLPVTTPQPLRFSLTREH